MEINRYYTDLKPSLETFDRAAVIEAYRQESSRGITSVLLRLLRLGVRLRAKAPWLFVLPLLVLGLLEVLVLRIALLGKSRNKSRLHEHAVELASRFSEQYPLWPYLTVSKCLELAFLEQELIPMLGRQLKVVEVAIGEGTFSARIFPPTSRIVGLDINPVSLKKASELPHVNQAVVCDCLEPPLLAGSFDVLLANNFLHHVSDKSTTLARWSELVCHVVFNESTPFWALSWPIPFLLRKVGLRKWGHQMAETFRKMAAQDLQPEPVVTGIVEEHLRIVRKESYFSERTYFLANLFCLAGLDVVIPEEVKRVLLGKCLRSVMVRLTTALTKLLLRFDQFQDRSRDVLISYAGESKSGIPANPPPEGSLGCPACKDGALDAAHKCLSCGTHYKVIDGMLFLLPPRLKHIAETYDPAAAAAFPGEHL